LRSVSQGLQVVPTRVWGAFVWDETYGKHSVQDILSDLWPGTDRLNAARGRRFSRWPYHRGQRYQWRQRSMDHCTSRAGNAFVDAGFECRGNEVRGYVDQIFRASIEGTHNGFLDTKADVLCGARKYQRTDARYSCESYPGSCNPKHLNSQSKNGEQLICGVMYSSWAS